MVEIGGPAGKMGVRRKKGKVRALDDGGSNNELTAALSRHERNFSTSANNQLCIPNRSIVSRNRNLHHKHSVSPTSAALCYSTTGTEFTPDNRSTTPAFAAAASSSASGATAATLQRLILAVGHFAVF